MTVIDCGPSRYAIWRRMENEDAPTIVNNLTQIFSEFGPPDELLMDNGRAFRSQRVSDMLDEWNVEPLFRAAYRPSGNGIVERNHRTIKRTAERCRFDPVRGVFWYNAAPLKANGYKRSPADIFFHRKVRVPKLGWERDAAERANAMFRIGDRVFVKPPGARCTAHWAEGTVTRIVSGTNVEVDGVPRHVADLRMRAADDPRVGPDAGLRVVAVDEPHDGSDISSGNDSSDDSPDDSSDDPHVDSSDESPAPVPPAVPVVDVLRRSRRVSRPPTLLGEFDRT